MFQASDSRARCRAAPKSGKPIDHDLVLAEEAIPPGGVGDFHLGEDGYRFANPALKRQRTRQHGEIQALEVGLAVLAGHLDRLPASPLRFSEAPGEIVGHGNAPPEGVEAHEPLPRRPGSHFHFGHAGHPRFQVAPEARDKGQLEFGQQHPPVVARLLEELSGREPGPFGGRQLTRAPGQEAGQAELDRRPPPPVADTLEDAVDGPQGRNGQGGVGVGPMVDHPFRFQGQGVEDLQPAFIPWGQQVHQRAQDGQALPVQTPFLGLTGGFAQRADSFSVAPLGRAGEMGGGLPQAPGCEEDAGDQAMQGAPAGRPQARIDRLGDERVGQLVGHLLFPFFLGHQPGPDQTVEDGSDTVEGTAGQGDDAAQFDPVAHHGEQLEGRPGWAVQGVELGGDPLPERLGEPVEAGGGQVGSFVLESLEEAEGEEGVAPRAFVEPGDEGGRWRLSEDGTGQVPDGTSRQRCELQAAGEPVLLEAKEDRGRPLLGGKLGGAGGGQDQDRRLAQIAGQVVESVPGRGVGQMHVIEEDEERALGGEVGDEHGQSLEEPGPWRFTGR